MIKDFCFVLDGKGSKLSPTNTNNGWKLIRKNKASLVNKFPMVIKLNREIEECDIDTSEIICGIDTGSNYTGIAIVQKGINNNKPLFKGTLEHRKDVKQLMDTRGSYRRYRRYHKRYRETRFNNRSSSRRKGRLAPSILQKKESIVRVINRLNNYIRINKIIIEDVAIDIRALQEGKRLYNWRYQKSNRLDENIRKATILRDKCKCMDCGKTNCIIEVHHITPRRLKGSNSLDNLITLCVKCHDKTKGNEMLFADKYYKLINGKNIRFDYAQHVMQGKLWLRNELNIIANIELTIGSDTANKRIDWNIDKSHSNDAIVICGLEVNRDRCAIKEWLIKPMRRKSKAKTDNVLGIKHRDLVSYTYKNGESHTGYVTALYPSNNALNFQSKTKHCKKVNVKKCSLLWKFNKIYWL